MTDKKRTLAVRVVLGLLMAVMGVCMVVGCPIKAGPPLQLRASDTVTVHANLGLAHNGLGRAL
jgi:hypothetical protein